MNKHILKLASPRLQKVISAVQKNGGTVFTSAKRAYNLNIVGIRNAYINAANDFDDALCVFWFDGHGWNEHFFYNFSTDPGKYWLANYGTRKGTAILVPGQYRGAYKIDLHNGKYTALCQRLKPVKVYRDSNKNNILDKDPATIETGMFGINIHRASLNRDSLKVGAWSAGCQVFRKSSDFDIFMNLCQNAAEFWDNEFTYTLIQL